jgi:hypothetical protein
MNGMQLDWARKGIFLLRETTSKRDSLMGWKLCGF